MLLRGYTHRLESGTVRYKPAAEGIGRDTCGHGEFVFIHRFVCHSMLVLWIIHSGDWQSPEIKENKVVAPHAMRG